MLDLTGQVFGYLTALKRDTDDTHYWICRRICGKEVKIWQSSLRQKNTKSCGCKNRARKTHGEANKTVEYQLWLDIKERCYDPLSKNYKNYGSRGIKLYKPWHEYIIFIQDLINLIGRRPSKEYSLDRIDNNKGYEPGNIRWATKIQQARNKRNVNKITIDGVERTIYDWSKIYKIRVGTIKHRLRRGWDSEKAVITRTQSGKAFKV